MDSKMIAALIGFVGLLIGYGVKVILERYKARNSLLESIAPTKVTKFTELWKICESTELELPMARYRKYHQLKKWYNEGGGLLLSFKATERMQWAKQLLKTSLAPVDAQRKGLTDSDFEQLSSLEQNELALIKDNLSWLRTHTKMIVGSYSPRESRAQLSDIPGKSKRWHRIPKSTKRLYRQSSLVKEIKQKSD